MKASWNQYVPSLIWIFFFLCCWDYLAEITSGGSGWKTAAWLINYSTGPIRRGLIGTLLLYVSDWGFPLLWVTYALQVACQALVCVLVLKLYRSHPRHAFLLILLFSPAFIMFPFHHSAGAFRQEILGFVPVAVLSLSYARRTLSQPRLFLVAVLFACATLSHEVNAVMIPAYWYLFYKSNNATLMSARMAWGWGGVFGLICLTSVLFALAYQGDAAIATAQCNALLERGLNKELCHGAVSSLGQGPALFWQFMLQAVDLSEYIYNYAVLLLLSVAPLFLTTWIRKETVLLLSAGLLFMLPLFVLAIDWGRWIHIYIVMMFCIALTENLQPRIHLHRGGVFVATVYLTVWAIPVCCLGKSLVTNLVERSPAKRMALSVRDEFRRCIRPVHIPERQVGIRGASQFVADGVPRDCTYPSSAQTVPSCSHEIIRTDVRSVLFDFPG